jgi:IS5 family transposase
MIKPQTKIEGSSQLFETPLLEDTLRQDHPLIILSKAINWDDLIDKISAFYSEKEGRPTLPIRLMIGLLLIKYLFNMSDAEVVANWEENIYHQAFTGQGTFVKGPPCHPSQLTLFRQRIKEKGCEIILAESVRLHGTMALEKTCIIDTTVQEKNITYPTDSKLLLKAIAFILKIGLFLAIPFTRNYKKEVKTLKKDINFSKGKLEPQKKEEKVSRLRTIANALFKDFLCKIPKKLLKLYPIAHSLMVLKKVINQKKDDKDKIYSINEPQTQCIIKGKTDKKYEFGSKVSFVLSKCTGIILGALNFKNNIYDGDTIEHAINQFSRLHN